VPRLSSLVNLSFGLTTSSNVFDLSKHTLGRLEYTSMTVLFFFRMVVIRDTMIGKGM